MAAEGRRLANLTLLGVYAAVAAAALALGAGTAIADPDDPGLTDVGPTGHVDSPQSASISGAKPCIVDPGTLGTASSDSGDIGVPMQQAHESGPSWVGSNGWQAIGTSNSNPWGGNFNPQNTKTGPHCGPSKAGHF
ncbi:MAG: hypothetical protein AB7G47_04600 [Mycolicibacterium sp.]|uniref:hypothetical protein n=1 Tax=Mycolicibacterium sp. TaxID=2320850 RepID=UPI003D12C03D